jgi:N-acetyl-anhydromuramyl-L-alanine amidase AmpD
MREYPRFIIIHHTAYKDSSILEIDGIHRARGWGQIISSPDSLVSFYRSKGFPLEGKGVRVSVGYHYYIRNNGAIERGRPDFLRGAHCLEDNMNRDAIAIALGGNFDVEDNEPSIKQQISLTILLKSLKKRYQIPRVNCLFHREVKGAATLCPGRNFTRGMLEDLLDIEHMFDL